MTTVAALAAVADLIGEPARAAMLVALMDGRALTAGELATAGGVTASTASVHLARMAEAGLLAMEAQGRHRYFRLASPSVGERIETLMALSSELEAARSVARRISTGPRDAALRHARVCYDHLAGEVAVALADAMVSRGLLRLGPEGGWLTQEGERHLADLGVDLGGPSRVGGQGGTFCKACLDWSVRRHHVGGRMGRALLACLTQRDWVRRAREGRGVTITPVGAREMRSSFGIDVPPQTRRFRA